MKTLGHELELNHGVSGEIKNNKKHNFTTTTAASLQPIHPKNHNKNGTKFEMRPFYSTTPHTHLTSPRQLVASSLRISFVARDEGIRSFSEKRRGGEKNKNSNYNHNNT